VTGGYAGAGGAMELDDSTLRIRNCYLQGNTSAGDGGAVRLSGNSNPIFEECVLTGNAAAGAGGAIQAEAGARPIFVGCTVAGNRSATSGGGAHASEGAAITFDRSILWGNGAGTAGADAWTADASSSIRALVQRRQPRREWEASERSRTERGTNSRIPGSVPP
jgi:hypothetical protein